MPPRDIELKQRRMRKAAEVDTSDKRPALLRSASLEADALLGRRPHANANRRFNGVRGHSAPVISGTVALGNSLSITDDGGFALFTILRNGAEVAAATSVDVATIEAYAFVAADIGPFLQVRGEDGAEQINSNSIQPATMLDLTGATTRFYLHAALAAPTNVAPAFDAFWTDSNEALSRTMSGTVDVDAIAQGTTIDWTAAAKALDRQYISIPLHAGTISGTIKCQIRSAEIAGGDNVRQVLGLRVVSAGGGTVRGTLLAPAFLGVIAELGTDAGGPGPRNRFWANGDAIGSVAALEGDRLVLELGYEDVTGTTPEAFSSYGSTAASDLPEDETTLTALRPWFQITVP